jgi:hypothetical protein
VKGPRVSVEGKAQLRSNPLKNGIEIAADLGVGQARDADADAFEILRPSGVAVGEPFVSPAVPLAARHLV